MIRIISGKFRKTSLLLPDPKTTRPTSDRVREAIFNMLTHSFDIDFDGSIVLDAFAGSGAMGLEAVSRGSSKVIFLEKDRDVLKILQANIHKLKVDTESEILKHDIEAIQIATHPVDLVFMDPPYNQKLENRALCLLKERGWIGKDTLICIERSSKSVTLINDDFQTIQIRTYGAASVVFLKLKSVLQIPTSSSGD